MTRNMSNQAKETPRTANYRINSQPLLSELYVSLLHYTPRAENEDCFPIEEVENFLFKTSGVHSAMKLLKSRHSGDLAPVFDDKHGILSNRINYYFHSVFYVPTKFRETSPI